MEISPLRCGHQKQLAQLARAYRELGEFRLRLQGKGPPKAVDYAKRKTREKPSAGFTETQIAPQAKPGAKGEKGKDG